MKVKLYKIGKVGAEYEELAKTYLVRVRPMLQVEAIVVKNDTQILDALDSKGLWIFCDAQGEEFSTEDFAAFLKQKIEDPSQKQLNFVIGGPFGFTPELRGKIQRKLSLSSMTFPNELAWLILCEQVYRAASILHGLNYHH